MSFAFVQDRMPGGEHTGFMTSDPNVRRIVPNLATDDIATARSFYTSLLGLNVAMDLEWVATLSSPNEPAAQLNLIAVEREQPAPVPDMSIEVADVDAVHASAVASGHEVVYPVTDEPWGVRRFFVRDPDGRVVNVLSHT